jgi:hypothetical protein
LGTFVPSGQENNQFPPTFLEVHPITGAVIDSQFGYALANRFGITRIAGGKTLNPDLNARPCLNVDELIEPPSEEISFPNFDQR